MKISKKSSDLYCKLGKMYDIVKPCLGGRADLDDVEDVS